MVLKKNNRENWRILGWWILIFQKNSNNLFKNIYLFERFAQLLFNKKVQSLQELKTGTKKNIFTCRNFSIL